MIKKNEIDDRQPSEITNISWLFAPRKINNYPSHTKNGGKWLIFIETKNIDEVWEKIKLATINGLLGSKSKVSTAKENINAHDINKKLICVYKYDYTDKSDVMRIRESLRDIGIINKNPYKTDTAILENKYQVNGNQRISIYYE